MLQKDSILLGLLIGLVVPFIGYALVLEIYDQLTSSGILSADDFSETFRKRTTLLLSICLNLIPLSYFSRKFAYDSMRGIVFPTVLYVAIWFFYYGKAML